MNELMKIDYSKDTPTVSGRELHAVLKVKTEYKDWFPRMCEYGFVEGTDFRSFLSESTGGRPAMDHEITVDMAKELCMLQRTEKGKECRQYFIELEKKWNDPASIMARALQLAERQIEALKTVNQELLPKASVFDALVARDHLTNLRETAKEINVPERFFTASLVEHGYIYKSQSGEYLPYNGRYRGFFEVKDYLNRRNGHTGVQTFVNMHGKQHLWELFNGRMA